MLYNVCCRSVREEIGSSSGGKRIFKYINVLRNDSLEAVLVKIKSDVLEKNVSAVVATELQNKIEGVKTAREREKRADGNN